MKRLIYIGIILSLLATLYAFKVAYLKDKGIKTIVIDAGHGGHDSGCLGKDSKEKHIALKIALELGAKIQAKFPSLKIVYTRKTDVFIPLHKRADIANKHNADLFISIHCNASDNHSVYGSETFVMGLHKNDANLAVAKRENDVILKEDDHEDHYDGFDPNSPMSHIIFQMFQNAYLAQSIHFASLIQDEFKKIGRKNRGVKQAGFLVLYKTYMPSVLIESGFLTNLGEEKLMNSKEGRFKITNAIYKAFVNFKLDIEKHSSPTNSNTEKATPIQDKTIKTTIQKTATSNVNKDLNKASNVQNDIIEKDTNKAEIKTNSVNQSKKSISSKKSNNTLNKDSSDNTSVKTVNTPPQIIFSVQVASSNTSLSMADEKFKNLTDVREVKISGQYKYLSGQFKNIKEALTWQVAIRNIGIKDAFLVAFNGNQAISLSEAKQMQQKSVREK